jgi:hypothetical protein
VPGREYEKRRETFKKRYRSRNPAASADRSLPPIFQKTRIRQHTAEFSQRAFFLAYPYVPTYFIRLLVTAMQSPGSWIDQKVFNYYECEYLQTAATACR